ncbi:MAG: Swt1 family HEPN domain-containing protein [Chloroflexota bacterium]
MISKADLRSWFFKVLSVEETLDKLEAEGMAVRASTDPRIVQRVMPLDNFSREIRLNAMKSLPAYLGFFCLENSVRELVAERLLENHKSNWWDECASHDIRERVEGRRKKEGKNRWHHRRGEQEIFYTDFGDLKLIIQNNWEDFEDMFPDQNWIVSRLDELEASRNIIAHSNMLEERELERIRLYLDDWLRQVG